MNKQLRGTVNLPGSKSESNRALMIAAYGGFSLEADNLSEAHDTVLLQALLKKATCANPLEETTIDCEDAGTVSRFMMTYLSCQPGRWLLTGTERMRQRPMAPLIKALRQLGAEITCVDKEGMLPVRIHGKELNGGEVALDASLSSQFVSSLLLAAPMWRQGLKIKMSSKIVSEPYIRMTHSMMERAGADVEYKVSEVVVRYKPYQPCRFLISADWSAASYWYEMMALSEGGELMLKGLKKDPLQGDSKVAEMYETFGVQSLYEQQGVRLVSLGQVGFHHEEPLVFDFSNTPDLFPSIVVTCVAIHCKAIFKGITTLYLKESDRINSLISELSKVYTFINIVSNDEIVIEKSSISKTDINNINVKFNTNHDHRIAMALAPLSLTFGKVSFDDYDVVCKSYPTFWEEVSFFY